jgi:hypothetical protein
MGHIGFPNDQLSALEIRNIDGDAADDKKDDEFKNYNKYDGYCREKGKDKGDSAHWKPGNT